MSAAWAAFNARQYGKAIEAADQCIDNFAKTAAHGSIVLAGSAPAPFDIAQSRSGAKDEAQVTADAKSNESRGTPRDIVDLIQEGSVHADATGRDIEQISLQLRNLRSVPVQVRIPTGTFFVARLGSAQNMVSREETIVTLRGEEQVSLSILAACANRSRRIPRSGDSFSVVRSPQQEELQSLMPALNKARASYAVAQAAVWIITDNADFDQMGSLRVGQYGAGDERVIREDDAARAIDLILETGVDIRRKAIFRDRTRLVDQSLVNAIRVRDLDRAKALLERGGNPNATGRDGTALTNAYLIDRPDFAQVLLDHGANVDFTSSDGITTLMRFSGWNKLDVVRALLNHGASIEARDNRGWTALFWATEAGELAAMKELLAAGANVNAKARDGSTSLIIGVRRNSLETVELLLTKGADPNGKADNGARDRRRE